MYFSHYAKINRIYERSTCTQTDIQRNNDETQIYKERPRGSLSSSLSYPLGDVLHRR